MSSLFIATTRRWNRLFDVFGENEIGGTVVVSLRLKNKNWNLCKSVCDEDFSRWSSTILLSCTSVCWPVRRLRRRAILFIPVCLKTLREHSYHSEWRFVRTRGIVHPNDRDTHPSRQIFVLIGMKPLFQKFDLLSDILRKIELLLVIVQLFLHVNRRILFEHIQLIERE